MEIKKQVSLRDLNTFGLDSIASYYVEVESERELQSILGNEEYAQTPKFILGGGSNVLLTQDLDALVIHPIIRGIHVEKEDGEHVWLSVGGGEVWHKLVMYCVDNGYAGIENMSLIPGLVGAAPMQNIGAYGVEVKDVLENVRAVSRKDGAIRIFSKADCEFGYRESVFKKVLKDQYVITGVVLKLNKQPDFRVEYGDIQRTLQEMGVTELSIKSISEAVIKIRQSKLPDPAKIGNAGSFFKNPEISTEAYEILKSKFPEVPSYPVEPGIVKVPAGWLIEKAGWKGYREGQIGVHERQALVLVNYGGGKGSEIKALSEKIKSSVFEKFGVLLSTEVNFI